MTPMDKWIAHYQPVRPEGMEDPSKRGFPTKELAWDYICRNHICPGCVKSIKENEYDMYSSKDSEDINNLMNTGCAAEWLVLKEEDYDKAETHFDLMEASGFKRIR